VPTRNCPLTKREVIDEYFIENRTKLLDVAAFLDRLDRAEVGGGLQGHDFRMEAFAAALQVLSGPGPARAQRISMILSDPTNAPLAALDRKGARGAYDPAREAG